MSQFVALAIASFAIDGLVWGFAGFFVFRLLGGGVGIESEPDVAGFLGSHGSLRGGRNPRRNL